MYLQATGRQHTKKNFMKKFVPSSSGFLCFFSKSSCLCVLYIIRYRKKRPNGGPRKRLRSVFRKKMWKNLEYIVIFSKFAADNSK